MDRLQYLFRTDKHDHNVLLRTTWMKRIMKIIRYDSKLTCMLE